MTQETLALVLEARTLLGHTARAFGEALGVSERTVYRLSSTGGLREWELPLLIRKVHPLNPDLAARLASSIGQSLPQLGISQNLPRAPSPKPVREHVDAVVCAAADALSLSPRDARPAVAAIFQRLRELNVELPALVELLADVAPKPKVG